jgi:Fe-S-cluster-containing dehydrogenase component
VFVEVDRSGGRAPKVSMCRFCKEPECAYACPHGALQPLPEGGITLTPSKCAVCKTYDCVEACQYKVLVLDDEKKVPILCDRCGECAKYCPHNVFWYTEAPAI